MHSPARWQQASHDAYRTTQLTNLYHRYLHTQTNKPKLHKDLNAQDFPTEVHKLLVRYTEGATCKTKFSKKIKQSNQWALPPSVHAASQGYTGFTKERFASR